MLLRLLFRDVSQQLLRLLTRLSLPTPRTRSTPQGCTHHLELLSFNRSFGDAARVRMHPGNTASGIFLATDYSGRESVLKIRRTITPTVTFGKIKASMDLFEQHEANLNRPAHEAGMAKLVARLAAECGLDHLAARERTESVRAVLPFTAVKVQLPEAVLAEYVRGASLEAAIIRMGDDHRPVLKALGSVPHSLVRDAALFDLLLLQADRHAENVMVDTDGYLRLIDTADGVLSEGIDNVFFPNTYAYTRALLSARAAPACAALFIGGAMASPCRVLGRAAALGGAPSEA